MDNCDGTVTSLTVVALTYLSREDRAQFTHRIWTILPRWATVFCELARRIWQNFPWKNVGANDLHYEL